MALWKCFLLGWWALHWHPPSPDICPLDGFRGQTNLAIDDHPTTSASVSILGDTTFNLRNGPVNKFYLHTRPSWASLFVCMICGVQIITKFFCRDDQTLIKSWTTFPSHAMKLPLLIYKEKSIGGGLGEGPRFLTMVMVDTFSARVSQQHPHWYLHFLEWGLIVRIFYYKIT